MSVPQAQVVFSYVPKVILQELVRLHHYILDGVSGSAMGIFCNEAGDALTTGQDHRSHVHEPSCICKEDSSVCFIARTEDGVALLCASVTDLYRTAPSIGFRKHHMFSFHWKCVVHPGFMDIPIRDPT